MQNTILSIATLIITLVFSNTVVAQKFPELDKSPMDASAYPSSYRVSDKTVKVIYSRPKLKNRSLEKLAPNGKIWRTGANEAAEITFYTDVIFGGEAVKAGTYSMFTIPDKNEWTVVLNAAKNVWGSYFYNDSEDVVRVKGKVSKSPSKIEAFSIVFEGEDDDFAMYLGWSTTVVAVPIQIKEEE